MVAGARDIEEAHVVVNPAGKSVESVAGGRGLSRPSTHSIINLIPEHLCFTKTGSASPTPSILLSWISTDFLVFYVNCGDNLIIHHLTLSFLPLIP